MPTLIMEGFLGGYSLFYSHVSVSCQAAWQRKFSLHASKKKPWLPSAILRGILHAASHQQRACQKTKQPPLGKVTHG